MTKINNDNVKNAGQYLNIWNEDRIKENILVIINKNPFNDIVLNYDKQDNSYYISNNNCYLSIGNKIIWIGSNRENVFSSDVELEYEIENEIDIFDAYNRFYSMVCEDEE